MHSANRERASAFRLCTSGRTRSSFPIPGTLGTARLLAAVGSRCSRDHQRRLCLLARAAGRAGEPPGGSRLRSRHCRAGNRAAGQRRSGKMLRRETGNRGGDRSKSCAPLTFRGICAKCSRRGGAHSLVARPDWDRGRAARIRRQFAANLRPAPQIFNRFGKRNRHDPAWTLFRAPRLPLRPAARAIPPPARPLRRTRRRRCIRRITFSGLAACLRLRNRAKRLQHVVSALSGAALCSFFGAPG